MHKPMLRFNPVIFLWLAALVALPACRHKKEPSKPLSELNAWTSITPAEAGLDAERLKVFSDSIAGNGVVVRHDRLAYSWGRPNANADVASAAKPIMVHFLFKAVEEGIVGSIDDPVVKFEPRLSSLNPALDHKDTRITWRHLMNQTSGYGLIEPPGEAFGYNDFQSQLFWDVLFHNVYGCKANEATDQVLRPRLFDQLGALDKPYYRIRPAPQVSGRLVVSARDFARVGLLYLHGGQWKGKQVIDKKWVELALHNPLPLSLPRTSGKEADVLPGARTMGGGKNQEENLGGYSFMWWLNRPDAHGKLLWPDVPADAIGAVGHGGLKVLIVIPSLDLVVSWNGVNLERREMCVGGRDQINTAMKKLIEAVR